MKQFIYLDNDTVNSIVAQINKGLVLEASSELENLSAQSKEKSVGGELSGKTEGGLFNLVKAQGGLSINGEYTSNQQTHETSKEIATKIMHDAAYDMAYDYIKQEQDSLLSTDADLGRFVELQDGLFEVIDLEYLESLFTKGGFIEFVKKTEREKIETATMQETTALSREQQRAHEKNIQIKLKEIIEKSNKEYDDILEIIRALRCIVPYSRMLYLKEGYLIPLEDKYFRDNHKTIGFKHGGFMTCVGYITNVIGSTSAGSGKSETIFSQIQLLASGVIKAILPESTDIFIVHPVAIFYGR